MAVSDDPYIHRGARRWRSALAFVISIALVLGLFHCGFSEDTSLSSNAVISDNAGYANTLPPLFPACPKGDHCLTHVASMTPQQKSDVALRTRAHCYGAYQAAAPDGIQHATPFKPPRIG